MEELWEVRCEGEENGRKKCFSQIKTCARSYRCSFAEPWSLTKSSPL